MAIRLAGLGRTGLVAIMGAAVMLVGTPPAAADADIRIAGGSATAAIVCGNVADAEALAQQQHILIQRAKCTSAATGGNVTLQDVDITVAGAARTLNRENPLLRELAAPPGLAGDVCENHRPGGPPGSTQVNKCWAIGRGGKLKMQNVKVANYDADGRVTTRTIQDATVMAGSAGGASALCTNVVNHPLKQRDDCTASGGAAKWSMQGVDVVVHNPDGTTSTRRGITVDVRGGEAVASIYCFNVIDGSGRVIQINICNGDATGGDATLKNIRINVLP